MKKISSILNTVMAVAIAICCGCQQKSIDGFERIPSPMEDINWIPDSIQIEEPDLSWIDSIQLRVINPTESYSQGYFDCKYLGGDSIEVLYSSFDLGTGVFFVDYEVLLEMASIHLDAINENLIGVDDTVYYRLDEEWGSHLRMSPSNPYYSDAYGDDYLVYANWKVGDTIMEVYKPDSMKGSWEIDDIFNTTMLQDFQNYDFGDSVEVYVWESFFRDHVIY